MKGVSGSSSLSSSSSSYSSPTNQPRSFDASSDLRLEVTAADSLIAVTCMAVSRDFHGEAMTEKAEKEIVVLSKWTQLIRAEAELSSSRQVAERELERSRPDNLNPSDYFNNDSISPKLGAWGNLKHIHAVGFSQALSLANRHPCIRMESAFGVQSASSY